MPLFYFDTLFTSARRKTHRFLILYIAENRNSSPKTGIANIKSHFRFALILAEEGRKYVTLDDPGIRDLAVREPALFLQRYSPPVIIDEIQYAPELLPYIKIYVDADKTKGSFWLTGTHMFPVSKGAGESLAGRVGIVYLSGLSNSEISGNLLPEFSTPARHP